MSIVKETNLWCQGSNTERKDFQIVQYKESTMSCHP